MAATVQPVIMTADLNRLLAFYTELLGATQASRFQMMARPSMLACG
jgi:catechol 2,3-dioxygenase-like lactoylglutathione lyase family enzyme